MSITSRAVPALGDLGIGWRREIAGVIDDLRPGFCEVIAESIPLRHRRARPDPALAGLVARGVPVIPHGVALSLGGTEPVQPKRVRRLAACARALGAPVVSEHIAFVRAGGVEAGHLLPVPRTREALDVLAANIERTRRELPAPLALENIASFVEWPESDLTESEFLTELVERTGVLLVLDVANVYANARNRGRDPLRELARLPVEQVAYSHVAGGREGEDFYHDTHTNRTPPEVLDLVTALRERADTPFMLERDGRFPPAAELFDELDAIAAAAGAAPITTGAREVWV
ncbi:hypothetical protein A5731_00205 [Mycolicibacterium conceptionense]|uniref:Endonuclease n=2 Tax=Mycolicibacterium TaxID=1866885 RepID=A0A1A1ZXN8_9MYCO|nr:MULTISPECIES: DUF692 domain-containing protein [Mycolicibacterium]MCW1825018.1 DUF692 domain-containing protein [Mycolicibacterium senegalense]OBB15507.1 hypothetical protein A5718_29590 [Mycolicibacterium conceptionense]OBF09248.1 hypothetical protein A5731_00205 [Mycolicibacterium conceptionense]OBF19657.1 hypothetical protein A5726_17590 [Mycolicibacterium conceptionense]OBF48235.1 hypothetical protein A5720_03455 [Mycolicibacterium conceptionense]